MLDWQPYKMYLFSNYVMFSFAFFNLHQTVIGKREPLEHRPDVLDIGPPKSGEVESWCEPKIVCKGIDANTIPYMDSHTAKNFAQTELGKFYDTTKVRNCFAGKRILMFGDSVMEEMVFDIAILLSGVAKNRYQLDKFVLEGTSQDIDALHTQYRIPGSSVTMHFYHGRRNVTIVDEKISTYVRHRYTGHASLKANNMGIQTFFRDRYTYFLMK